MSSYDRRIAYIKKKERPVIIDIADADAAQVRAILLTHAEMQDRSAMHNEELRGKCEDSEEVEELEDMHQTLTDDTDNLKRIAKLFE